MKKAAFFSFDWNYSIVSGFYRGAQRCISEHEDVQLVIFNAFGRYNNYRPEEGAFEIFSLCTQEDYDGFLIQGNRAWPPEMRQKLVDELSASGKPVISLNYELRNAGYAGTDNYAAEYGLVSKILREQKCVRPAFVNGLETSVEAGMRKQAYLDACREAGFEDPLCLQASWEMEAGIQAAEKLLKEKEHLPDIIFCCNDDLAVGVQETLQKNGIRVPEDVRITGFDNREIALRAMPRITTADRDYEMIGHTGMSALIRRMNGEEVPDHICSPVRYIFSESSGYGNESGTDEEVNTAYYSMNSALRQFYEMLSGFQPAVLSAETLPDILRECERCFPQLGCANAYLVLNDEYPDDEAARSSTVYGLKGALAAHWGEEIPAEYDYRHIYERFEMRRLLPECAPADRPVYMVFPLRQNTACIGYVLTEGVPPMVPSTLSIPPSSVDTKPMCGASTCVCTPCSARARRMASTEASFTPSAVSRATRRPLMTCSPVAYRLRAGSLSSPATGPGRVRPSCSSVSLMPSCSATQRARSVSMRVSRSTTRSRMYGRYTLLSSKAKASAVCFCSGLVRLSQKKRGWV